MKIALAQTDIIWENKEKNMATASRMIESAAKNNAALIVFPEMSLTGFSMNITAISENQNESQSIDFFSMQAIKNKISIGFGLAIGAPENKNYNKFIVVDSNGEIVADYSKIHPFSFGVESRYFCGGASITSCEVGNIIVSPFICYDLRFPEIFQLSSIKSTLLIVIANWPASRINHWETLLKARAIENQCFVAGINRVGDGWKEKYNGHSLVSDPYGNLITPIFDDEQLIFADLDMEITAKYRKDFPLKQDRRSDLYKTLNYL